MAVVKYGSIVTEIKGSIQGLTFQKCGQVLSARSNPYHKQAFTAAAQNSRNEFSYVVAQWNKLDASEKAAWSAVASSYPTFDKFGASVILTGYQIFMYINRFLYTANLTLITTAVAYSSHPIFYMGLNLLDLDTHTCELGRSAYYAAGYSYVLYISDCYSGNSYIPYKPTFFCCSGMVPTVPPDNVYDQVMAAFRYPPRATQRFNWEIWSVENATGQAMLEAKSYSEIYPL